MSYDLWIGIDVSKDTLDICVLTNTKMSYKKINNNMDSINHFFKDDKYKVAHVIMEATGIYHNKLVISLTELHLDFSVVNPLSIRRYSEMKMYRAKTDAIDAKIIAEYGQSERPKLFIFKEDYQTEMMELVKAINSYKEERTTFISRIKALDHKHTYSKDVYKSFQKIIAQINRQIDILNAKIDKIIEENFKEMSEKINKIPGVGKVLTSTIIGMFGTFQNFENPKQAVAFAGLNPHPRESGKSVKKSSNISKKGCPYIRKVLFMAALSAKEYNQSCRRIYYRLKNNGKSEYQARIAVAHKLLRQIFAVVKYDREFEENYVNIAWQNT